MKPLAKVTRLGQSALPADDVLLLHIDTTPQTAMQCKQSSSSNDEANADDDDSQYCNAASA
jgi:hypothetical protein